MAQSAPSDRYDFPLAYRSLTMNGHRTAAGILNPGSPEADTYRVTSFDFSRVQMRDQREALHLLPGGDLGDATIAFRYLSLGGMLKASTGARLDDMIAKLLTTFDIEECQRVSPSTEGVLPFTFTGLSEFDNARGTLFTDEHGVGGQYYLLERFLARPAAFPVIGEKRSGGNSATFAIELICPDRRRYTDTAEAVVANAGNGFTGSCPNWSTLLGLTVSPVLTIVMAGAGAANLTIAIAGSPNGPLVLNMSAETAGTFTVDCATGVIKKASTHRQDLRTSAVTTAYLGIVPGGGAMTVTNTAGVTSVTAAYRQARA